MDLEWNRSYDKKRLDEILQIGAVRVAAPCGVILSTFNMFIKPRVHKRFDPGARKLPDLQCSIDCDVDFPTAWAAFTDWCGDERVFAFWGPDDFSVIQQNCAFWGVSPIEPERVFNFQRAFGHACGTSTQLALWRVADYLNIPTVFDFHNALYDAMYTALVGAWLQPEDLDFAPSKKHSRPRHRRRLASHPAAQSAETRPAVPKQAEPAPRKKRRRRNRRRKKPAAGATASQNKA